MSPAPRRALTAGVAALVAAVVVAVTWLAVGRDSSDADGVAIAPGGPSPFAEDGSLPAGPSRARFSPNGSRLAVLVSGGVALAVEGELQPVIDRGGNVVDAAWFANNETLLVAEGPASTGALAVVDLDGQVRGSIALSEPVPFGSGHGMAVEAGGRRAALTAVRRATLGAEHRYIVEVDLETGKVRTVSDPAGDDEFGPRYLDDGSLVYSVGDDVVVGVVRGVDVARRRGRSIVVDGDDVGSVPEGTTVVDIAPSGAEVLVVGRVEGGQPRLRTVRLRPRA